MLVVAMGLESDIFLEGSAICKNLGNVVELWDIDCRAEKGQVGGTFSALQSISHNSTTFPRFLQIADPSKKIARLAETFYHIGVF
jgi:hypothetical protein